MPTLTASATSVAITGQIDFHGTGYTANGNVVLSDSLNGTSMHKADINGNFDTGTFNASSICSTAQTVIFTADDLQSGKTATCTVTFIVSAATTASSATSKDILYEFVYWSIPSKIVPNTINKLMINDLGLVEMYVVIGWEILGINIINLGEARFYIATTPSAYINWYKSNINAIENQTSMFATMQSMYEKLISPNNGYVDYNTSTEEFLIDEQFYWMPYNNKYAVNYNVEPTAIDPTQFNVGTSDLYMLIRSAEAVPAQTGILQEVIGEIEQPIIKEIDILENVPYVTPVMSNTVLVSKLEQEEAAEATTAVSNASNVGTNIWSALVGWLAEPLIIIGVVAVGVILLYGYITKPQPVEVKIEVPKAA